MIKNAKLSGYSFYMNPNIWGNFQICISAPLRKKLLKVMKSRHYHISFNGLEISFILLNTLTTNKPRDYFVKNTY